MTKLWNDRLCTIGLLGAALLLYTIDLGDSALRDWDEGLVAQVARDIWQAPAGSQIWLHPTLAGAPYLNKPPLVHWLIALAYRIGGVNEWTTRLPGAIVSALSVPLLYGIGRELFPRRTPALLAALIYLTLLPIVRQGRLAMLDGVLITEFLLLLLCLLRSRRNLRWGLGVGIAFGLLCLTKGIAAVLLGAIALGFVLLDTPRLLTSRYLWTGLLLGGAPAIAWYWAQWLHYGQEFVRAGLVGQSLSRIWSSVENNRGEPWFYALELLKYAPPWLLFLPWAVRFAWENRSLSWAKLVLLWSGGYLLIISLMTTKLPWYLLPMFPALALMLGAYLSRFWNSEDLWGLPQTPPPRYPVAWALLFGIAAIGGWISCVMFGLGDAPKPDLQITLAALSLTLTAVSMLLLQRDSQFIPVLVWGKYIALLLLMLSSQWVWELNEAYPVKPVAAIVQQHTPPGRTVFTSYPYNRPSLNFYSDRPVIPVSLETLKQYWQQPSQPYLLVDQSAIDQLRLTSVRQLDRAAGWSLLTRTAANSNLITSQASVGSEFP